MEVSFVNVWDSLLEDDERWPVFDAVRFGNRRLVDLHEQSVQRVLQEGLSEAKGKNELKMAIPSLLFFNI